MDHAPKPKLHLDFFHKKCIHIFYLQKHYLTISKSHLLLPISNWISQSNVVWSFKCLPKDHFFCEFNSNCDIFKILLNRPITLSTLFSLFLPRWRNYHWHIGQGSTPSPLLASGFLLSHYFLQLVWLKYLKPLPLLGKKYGASKHLCLTPLIGNAKIIVPLT